MTEVAPAWPAKRDSDARSLPALDAVLGVGHTHDGFKAAVQSDRARLMVEEYFYKVDSSMMSPSLRRKLAVFCTGFALAIAASVVRADFEGRVVRVTDGDTVTVLASDRKQVRVRLSGIDAPEKRQAFGTKSKVVLSECAFGKVVAVDGHKTDRFGRLVAVIKVNGTDCGLRQIQMGMAWHYKAYQREQAPKERAEYSAAENHARSSRVGLWSDPDAEPPWQFRHSLNRSALK